MLQALKNWFGFTAEKKAGSDDVPLAFCMQSPDRAPPTSLQDKIVVVCRGPELSLRKEEALPDRLEPGEVCWILPRSDVRLPVDFLYGTREIRAVVVLRFEGDRAFALHAANLLVSGKREITGTDLARFVAGQWSELLSLQNIDPDRLSSRNPETVSRFRTNLSLLLQENGFRCVGIESIEVTDPRTPEPEDSKLPETVTAELNAAVKQVSTEADWDCLLDRLDEAGFEPGESNVEKLETLGEDYLARKISVEDASVRIGKMIERNNLEVGLISERAARWNATDAKLRLLDSLDGQPEEFLLKAGTESPGRSKVPSTWYLLRRQKIDEKLQKYLKSAVNRLETLSESARKRQSGLVDKAKLAPSQATLKRIADKIAMTPALRSGTGSMKRRQRRYDDLIAAVRRSVTATQLAEGLLRSLASEDYPKEQYLATVGDLEATLTTLENEITDRKNIYGV